MTDSPHKDWTAFVDFVRKWYATEEFICLHEPQFRGKEIQYVNDAIESTFVSSVGAYVDRFEQDMAEYTSAAQAIACVNGTSALHAALHILGVGVDDEVITQPISFVATTNAITLCGAKPVFVDVEEQSCGMSPDALRSFLEHHTVSREGTCFNRETGKRIAACVPVHVFGHPLRIQQIVDLCDEYGVPVVEDAAESLGSTVDGKHCGTLGKLGVLSFNGNKIVTTGGGGIVLSNDEDLGALAKHVTTTAKIPHRWNYEHDQLGFNYRMPNINAALGCGQLEQIQPYLEQKRSLASAYANEFADSTLTHIPEPPGTQSNYWLNAFRLDTFETREAFLKFTNDAGIMTRPVWTPLHRLPMYRDCGRSGDLPVAEVIGETVVNVPSGLRKVSLR